MTDNNMDQDRLVRQAQAGDLDAFSSLVRRYQDIAVGYAYSILQDFHLAEDAAQEAFIEACRIIGQLRTPAAFASWFRRIVFKHCDRIIRRKRPATAPLYEAAYATDDATDPLAELTVREERAAVQTAVNALPDPLREAITLFYISDYSQKEIAAFIGAPVTTVQKRLYEGRRRLKERMIRMTKKTIRKQAPSQDDAFFDAVALCAAAQAGDLDRVQQMLDAKPDLLNDPHPHHAREPIHYAAREGHAEIVQLLIDRGADPLKGVYPNRKTTNALALARDRGHKKTIDVIEGWLEAQHRVVPAGERVFKAVTDGQFNEAHKLLDADPRLLEAGHTEGITLAHAAAEVGAWQFILELKDLGLDIDREDNDRIRPVQVALHRPWMAEPSADLVTASTLLSTGAKYDFWTVCVMGDLETVRERLKADPSLASHNHCRDVNPSPTWYPLTKAALEGHEEIVRLLLDAGADPNAYIETLAPRDDEGLPHGFRESGMPLLNAIAKRHFTIAHLLLDRGASIHGAMYAGPSIEDIAFESGDDALIERFLLAGARPNMSQVFHATVGNLTAVVPFITRAAEKMPPDRSSDMTWGAETLGNMVHWAAGGGELGVLRLCLTYKPVFTEDQWFKIAWETMRTGYHRDRKNRVEAFRVLLEYGMDPNIKYRENETLLHWISSADENMGNLRWVLSDAQTVQFAEALIEYGAEVNAMDDESLSTALAWAARYGREPLVAFLLDHDADPNLAGEPWATPLGWTERNSLQGIVMMLKDRGATA